MNKNIKDQLKQIIPGKTYPRGVTITETVDGKFLEVRFLLQSYVVGMYCAIHFDRTSVPHQTGDHDNKKFVRSLKKDILKALERGADVTIESISPIVTDFEKTLTKWPSAFESAHAV
jgi:hypothetical protein